MCYKFTTQTHNYKRSTFYGERNVYLKWTSWAQFWCSTQSTMIMSKEQPNIGLTKSVDLGHIIVIELLRSLFDLVLFDFGIHNDVVVLSWFCSTQWLGASWWWGGIVASSPGWGGLLMVLRLPSEPRCLGPAESGWPADLFVAVDACQWFLLAVQTFASASALGEEGDSFFAFHIILIKKKCMCAFLKNLIYFCFTKTNVVFADRSETKS